jgi:hypothetical protein
MLGTDKSRGYCLEMIGADFLAGASLEGGNPEILLQSIGLQVPARSPKTFRSHLRLDTEEHLITLCNSCHSAIHGS